MLSPASKVQSPAIVALQDLARMESHHGCVDATKLLDSLLKILPVLLQSLLQNVVSNRRILKQARYLGSFLADLTLIRGREEALPFEAVQELKLICTVNSTRHNDVSGLR